MDANMVSNSLLCHDTREQLYQGNNNNVEDKPKICSNSEPEMFQSNGADDEDSDKTLNSLVLPTELEFRRSGVHVGEGVWTKVDIARGEKLGPLEGEMRNTVEGPTTSAWEMLDDTGRVIGWWDSSHSNHWMTYVRSTTKLSDYNVFAVQKENKVFYQSCRDLCAGEELLLCVGHELVQDKDISVHPEAQEVRSYPCQKCQQAFKSKVALRRHETYVCNNLQTVFRQHMDRRTLHNVLKQDRGESSVPRQEEASGETKSEITRVEPDIENIQDEEDIEVDVVDAADDILLPQAIQVSNKVFYCDNCPLVFRHPDELQGHIRSEHPGARSHPCPDCGKTFATSSGLKQHQHIHSSVKPFQCEVCFKAYTQFSNLCRHKRMHADCRQPVKCDMCQQTFSTLHSLSKHKPFCGQVSAPSKPKQEKGQGRSLPVTDEPVKRKEIIHDMPLIRPTDLGMKLLEPLRINTSLHYSIPGLNPYTNYFLTQGQQLLMNTQLPGMYPFGHKPVNTVQSDAVQEDPSDLKSENNNNSPAEYNAAKSFKRDDRPTVNYRKDSTPESCAKLYEIHQEMPGKRYQVEQPIPLIKTSATASSIQMDSEDEPLDLSAKTTDCPVPRVTHVFGSRASYQSEYSSHNSQKSEISPNPDVKAESINNQRHHQAQGCTAETDSNGTAEHDSYFDDNSPNFNQSVMSDNSSRPKSLQDSALFVTNNEDQFTCHICAKGFPRSANLIRHLRTHTGEQPYRCSDCDRCFSISSNLKRHINAVHHSSFVTVSCSLCGVAFTQLKKLQSHVRREHTVKSSVNKGSEVPETSSSDSSEEGGFSVSTYNRKTQVEGTPLYSDGPSAFGPLSLYKASSDVTASAVGGNLKRKMEPTENLYHLHKIYKKQRVETVC